MKAQTTMRGRRIGVDFDTTLALVFDTQVQMVNEKFGTDLTAESFTDWDTTKFLTEEQEAYLWEVFDRPAATTFAPPRTCGPEVVRMLQDEGATVYVMSDRPERHRQWVAGWLNCYVPGDRLIKLFPPPLILTSSPLSRSHDERQPTKLQAARCLGLDTFIEDAPHHARELADAGLTVYLVNTAANRDADTGGALRVNGWLDIVEREDMIRFPEGGVR